MQEETQEVPQQETLESAPNGKGSRLEKIEQRIAQLEAQKKAILAREKEKTRRERTRRLIQIGAISLKYFGLPDEITPAAYEQVARRIVAALEHIPAQGEQQQQEGPQES
jgi:hypothetical protein